MIKQTVAVLAAVLGLAVYGEIPTRAYVQNGLIAHWDGIENAGAGNPHDPTVVKWTDLKQGVTFNVNANSGEGFDGNAFILKTSQGSGKVLSTSPILDATLEAYILPMANVALGKDAHTPILTLDSAGAISFDSRLGGVSVSYRPTEELKSTLKSFDSGYRYVSELIADADFRTYSVRLGIGSCGVSIDGVTRAETEGVVPGKAGVTIKTTTNLRIDGTKVQTKAYSYRVYDRQLADAEAFHNHKVDLARFEDDTACVRLNGDKLQYRIRVTCDARLGTVAVNGGESQSGTIDLWVDEDGADTTLAFTPTARVREFRGWKGANVSETAAQELTITVSPMIMDIEPLVWSGKIHKIPTDYVSINAATAAEDVLDGDTLYLEDRTHAFDQEQATVYYRNRDTVLTNKMSFCAVVKRPLVVTGSSSENVVLDCGGQGGLLLDHPDAVVSNLTIKNFATAVTGAAGPRLAALVIQQGTLRDAVIDGENAAITDQPNLFAIYAASKAVLEDCSVKNVKITGGSNRYLVWTYGATFRRVLFSGNDTVSGTFATPGSTGYRIRYESCRWENNKAGTQLGVYGKDVDYEDCVFTGNVCGSNASLFGLEGGSRLTFQNCVITNNSAGSSHALIEQHLATISYLYMTNCLIAYNTNQNYGLMRLGKASTNEIVNTTIAYNTTTKSDNNGVQTAGFLVGDGDVASGKVYPAKVTLINSILWNNTAGGVVKELKDSYVYTDIEAVNCCLSPGTVMAGDNQTFGDPDFIDAAAGDFHLGHGSSCIDTGTELAATDVDLDGTARPIDGTGDGNAYWDIGCYEAPTPSIPLQTAVVLHDEEGLAPSSPRMSVTVTGSQLTGLTYEWWAVRNAGGTVTTNVVTGVGADYVFENLPLGSYTFVSVVRNDQGYAVTNETDKAFLSLIDTVYVSTTGAAVWPYETPETAARELADAVAVARNVRVLPGRYAFTHRVDEITETECLAAINRGVSVVGDADPAQVVIDCGRKGGFVLNHPAATLSGMTFANSQIEADTSSTVNIQAGAISNVVVCGSEEAARPMPFVYVGEGASATELVVTNCLVTVQSSTAAGFALVQLYGGRLKNARIASCSVTMRALRAERTDASVRSYVENVSICDNDFRTYYVDKCVFLKMSDVTELSVCRNTADSGKGYLVSMGGCRVERSRFVGNSGKGVILCDAPGEVGAKGYLVNSLVMGNTCSTVAAVSHVSGSSRDFTIESCTIANNMAAAEAAAGGVRAPAKDQHGSKMTLLNTIVFGNTVDGQPNDVGVPDETLNFEASYSCFRETSLYPAANNLSADPLLKAGGKLTSGSPCIGTGLAQDWHATGFDLDGRKRVSGRGIDLGCFEFRSTPLVIIIR